MDRPRRASYQEIAVGTASAVLVSANNHRRSLLISNPTANSLWIAFGKTAVAGQSILIPATMRPYVFRWEDWGTLLTQDVNALLSVAAGTVAVMAVED